MNSLLQQRFAGRGLAQVWNWVLMVVLPPLIMIAVIHLCFGPVIGDRGRQILGQFWSFLASSLIGLGKALVKWVIGRIK